MPMLRVSASIQPSRAGVRNRTGMMRPARERGIKLTSFPAVLGERLLDGKHTIVVTGTHGKTTTTSLVEHILRTAGRDPSLFVGGVPVALGQGWRLGSGAEFVIEGDEY